MSLRYLCISQNGLSNGPHPLGVFKVLHKVRLFGISDFKFPQQVHRKRTTWTGAMATLLKNSGYGGTGLVS